MKHRNGGRARAEQVSYGASEEQQHAPARSHEMPEVRGARVARDARGKQVPEDLTALVDKMGARIAFERVGVAAYDALIHCFDAHGSFEGGPSRAELVDMRDHERDHYDMLCRTMGGIGADPTALTPSAHHALHIAEAVKEIVTDPHGEMLAALEAIMIAELVDHHGWEGLVELAELAGYEMMADRFGDALATEVEHVARVREWIAVGQGRRPTATDMDLVEFIAVNKANIMARWVNMAAQRLPSEPVSAPQLIDHMPAFLDELVQALGMSREHWLESCARLHGRHRVGDGVDIGSLAAEFSLVLEAIVELAGERGLSFAAPQMCRLIELIGRGAAESVREYAQLRDRQASDAASRHFTFLAHELRSPLQTARLAAQLLQQGAGDGDRQLGRLDRAHSRLLELLDNSLLEARLLGRPKPQYEEVDLPALLLVAMENVGGAADAKEVRVEANLEVETLHADPRMVLSVLTNLLSNAIKFTERGSVVKVDSAHDRDVVLIDVSDHCGGIPADKVPHLFEAFTQAGDDRSGFGLGLLIVKQAVEAHGGSVEVINQPGDGCCFRVKLPAYT